MGMLEAREMDMKEFMKDKDEESKIMMVKDFWSLQTALLW